jgi:hypothetical protein
MIKALVITVVVVILGFAGFTWLSLHWAYSQGEHDGYVQKLARKGWVCKTWEGEMAMVSLPGTMSEKFNFTVTDDAVVAQINAAMGKRVALTYEQHPMVPSSCFGETEYFITGVRVTE